MSVPTASISQELYNKSMNLYNNPKPAEDIDLTDEVRKLLMNAGLLNNVINFYDSDQFIIDSYGKHSSVQRYYQNRFWTSQLPRAVQSSTTVRTYLINDGSVDTWLNMFNKYILPFIKENSLPTGL